jgi:Domain of unknown function (DUF4340)
MSRQRFLALLVAAVIAIGGALYLSAQRNQQRETIGVALLPALAGEINTVTQLSVRRGSAAPTVTLHQQAGQWTVAERGDYPADVSKLRKLLLALSDAKIVEEKTSNPASFSVIGVDDPSSAGATGAEISITAQDGKHAVIIGKPVGEGNFARRVGENRSYSVEPSVSFETEPRFWIVSQLLDLPAATIQSVQIKPPTGAAYGVHRAAAPAVKTATGASPASGSSPAAGATPAAGAAPAPNGASAGSNNFVLEGAPPGRKPADSAVLAPSPTAFGGLSADDVARLSDIDFSKATLAVVTMSDGNVMTVIGATIGDKHWIQVQTTKDSALNAKTAGRAFEIASYRFDAIFRPLEQLLVPKTPPPVATPSAAKPSSAAKPASKP